MFFEDSNINKSVHLSNCTFLKEDVGILSEDAILAEGAKIDMLLQNFLDEGQDYKNLKSIVKEAIELNNLDDNRFRKTGRKVLHVFKRFLQCMSDLDAAFSIGYTVGGAVTIGFAPLLGVIIVVDGMLTYLLTRLIRYGWDTIEYSKIEDDAYEILNKLKKLSQDLNPKDPKQRKLKEKYESSISKIKNALDSQKD